jgi:hypothetical protein
LNDDIENIEAARARLRALREQRLADKIAAGEIVSVPLFIVAGSETEARAQVESAKADALAKLHASGETREIIFDVTMAVTGVVRCGEATDPAAAPSAPSFSSGEDVPRRTADATLKSQDDSEDEDASRPSLTTDATLESRDNSDPPPPLVETPIAVQIRACRDDDDPGEVVEGYFSVDGSTVTVTNKSGGHVGSMALLEGEDARVVAKQLLRGKKAPEEEFNRPLSYPNAGLA